MSFECSVNIVPGYFISDQEKFCSWRLRSWRFSILGALCRLRNGNKQLIQSHVGAYGAGVTGTGFAVATSTPCFPIAS
jgi:hypothetical protein